MAEYDAFKEVHASLDRGVESVRRATTAVRKWEDSQERFDRALEKLAGIAEEMRQRSDALTALVPCRSDPGPDVILH